MVVDFGHGAHCGPAASRSHALFHGYGRRQIVDPVNVGFFHAPGELTHVGTQAFHITALPFGVEGVKSQRALARAAETSNHREGAQRNVHVDAFEVVHSGASDAYFLRKTGAFVLYRPL